MHGAGWLSKAVGAVTGAALLAAGLALGGATAAGAATTSFGGVLLNAFEARLAADINSARHSAGLPALAVAGGTTEVARAWAGQMAAANAISHNPSLVASLQSHGSPNWTFIAENVGVGPASNADDLFQAYMNSSEHRANILSPQSRYLGVGAVAGRNGTEFNTLDFVDSYAGALAAVSAPSTPRAVYAISPVSGLSKYATSSWGTSSVTPPWIGRTTLGLVVRAAGQAGSDGGVELIQTVPVNLTGQSVLHLFVAAAGANGQPVPITVYVLTTHGMVRVGAVWVNGALHWATLALPAAARTVAYRTVIYLPAYFLYRAGGRVVMSLGTEVA